MVLDLNLMGREDGVNFLNQLQSGAGNKTNAIVQTRLRLVVWKDIENGPRMIWDGSTRILMTNSRCKSRYRARSNALT